MAQPILGGKALDELILGEQSPTFLSASPRMHAPLIIHLLRIARLICVWALMIGMTLWQAISTLAAEPASAVTAAHDKEPITIGVSCVQTGPSAELGLDLLKGSKAYFDRVNQSGGINGRQIKLIVKDDGYEPDPAVKNTHELIIKDDVFFLFDYVGTPTLTRVLPLLRYYRDKHLVNVAPFTGADPQRKPPYDSLVFNIRASYQDETKLLVDYLVSHGHKHIGFMGQADAYGKSGEIGVTQALVEHGLTPTGVVTYRRNQSTNTVMKQQVDILRSKGADAVICVGVYGPCATFIREARMQGWQVPIANVSFVGAAALLTRLREDSKREKRDFTTGLLCSQVVPCSTDSSYPLVLEFQSAFGEQSDAKFIALEGWLNASVVTEALRRMEEPPTRLGFVRAMESLGGWDPGLGVHLAFSRTNHLGMSKVWLTKTEGGRWVPETSELATR